MIFSENRYPPRIKSGAGFFGIMLWNPACDRTGRFAPGSGSQGGQPRGWGGVV